MNEITFTSTQQARTNAQSLSTDAQYYVEIVTSLENAKTQITANWEGDSQDILDITTRIDTVTTSFNQKIIPALNKLSNGVISFADAIDTTANQNVENGSSSVEIGSGSTDENSGTSGTSETENTRPGFWEYHGQDFADDWDYSGCDSGLDYIGKTIGGVVETAGSVVNFAVDGVSEILGWLFG